MKKERIKELIRKQRDGDEFHLEDGELFFLLKAAMVYRVHLDETQKDILAMAQRIRDNPKSFKINRCLERLIGEKENLNVNKS